MLPPVTRGPPLAVGTHPHAPLEATGGVQPYAHGCTHVVCGPRARKVLCPVSLLLTRAGVNNDVPPSLLRAAGEAAHQERGCYGNLRRMEPGTAITLNLAPSIRPGGRGAEPQLCPGARTDLCFPPQPPGLSNAFAPGRNKAHSPIPREQHLHLLCRMSSSMCAAPALLLRWGSS